MATWRARTLSTVRQGCTSTSTVVPGCPFSKLATTRFQYPLLLVLAESPYSGATRRRATSSSAPPRRCPSRSRMRAAASARTTASAVADRAAPGRAGRLVPRPVPRGVAARRAPRPDPPGPGRSRTSREGVHRRRAWPGPPPVAVAPACPGLLCTSVPRSHRPCTPRPPHVTRTARGLRRVRTAGREPREGRRTVRPRRTPPALAAGRNVREREHSPAGGGRTGAARAENREG